MIKPLIPIISDEWNHQFNEIEHISLVHAKYGSHHLEKELASSTADNNKSKDQNTSKTEDLIPFHVATPVCKYDLILHKTDIQYFSRILSNLPFVYISSLGQPPEFC